MRKKYNTGGGADQTTREKLKFHLDKKISKLKKGIDKKRPTKSEFEDVRARSRQDRKRTKHNIGGRANKIQEVLSAASRDMAKTGRGKEFKKKHFKDPKTKRTVLDTKRNIKRYKHNIGGRANLLEEMGRIDARKHPDAADRAEKSRVIRELNKGYKSGGAVLKGKKVGCQIK